jgi:hypothetical protein
VPKLPHPDVLAAEIHLEELQAISDDLALTPGTPEADT